MKLRTGLKILIVISILGIGVAVFLIYTCTFAGQIVFSTLVRQVPMEHQAAAGEHGGAIQKPRNEGGKDHPEAGQQPPMVIPNVRTYPIK